MRTSIRICEENETTALSVTSVCEIGKVQIVRNAKGNQGSCLKIEWTYIKGRFILAYTMFSG